MTKTAVLICTHNGEQFLEDQINSILNQTIKVDAIYIDDYNSSDNTIGLLEKVSKENSNIFFRRLPYANGPAASFLDSLSFLKSKLNGNYIIHITDQDDYWENNKNESVLEAFRNSNINATFHDVLIVDSSLNVLKESYYQGYYNAQRDLSLKIQTYTNCVIGHTLSITLETLRDLDLKYHTSIPMHDWYIVNQLLLHNRKIQFINNALSKYRQHDNNILGAQKINQINILKYIRQRGIILRKFISFQKEKKFVEDFNEYIEVYRNIKPFKKKFYIILALFLSRNDQL